jgi:hypothetical protein
LLGRNSLLRVAWRNDQIVGGNGSEKVAVHFNGENAVEQAAKLSCYCWCSCGWSGSGSSTGYIFLAQVAELNYGQTTYF